MGCGSSVASAQSPSPRKPSEANAVSRVAKPRSPPSVQGELAAQQVPSQPDASYPESQLSRVSVPTSEWESDAGRAPSQPDIDLLPLPPIPPSRNLKVAYKGETKNGGISTAVHQVTLLFQKSTEIWVLEVVNDSPDQQELPANHPVLHPGQVLCWKREDDTLLDAAGRCWKGSIAGEGGTVSLVSTITGFEGYSLHLEPLPFTHHLAVSGAWPGTADMVQNLKQPVLKVCKRGNRLRFWCSPEQDEEARRRSIVQCAGCLVLLNYSIWRQSPLVFSDILSARDAGKPVYLATDLSEGDAHDAILQTVTNTAPPEMAWLFAGDTKAVVLSYPGASEKLERFVRNLATASGFQDCLEA